MKKEKLLIIGAGIGQIPIILKAKELGVHITVVTKEKGFPGIQYADDVWYVDIYDRDELVRLAEVNGITGVISDQNDLMMPTVAYIAEKLNLPGNTFDQVMSYCNKNTYRNNCDLLEIPVPKHTEVTTEDFDFSVFDAPLPWVVKPADSQSSVGVQKIENMEELLPALKFALSKSPTHSAIVEEFFVGKEIVCEGFIENGVYHLLAFADRKYFKLESLMIPSQTLFPSLIRKELLDKVVTYEEKMAAYINPSFAITHSEYLINEETGEIRVVESALRGGGVYISSHLIPLATGIDINEILLKKALGQDASVEVEFARRSDAASGYICFYLSEGKVVSINGIDDLKNLDFVKMVSVGDIVIGEKSPKMLHKGLRKGPILVSGSSREELEQNIAKVQMTLNVDVVNETSKVPGIIWD